MKAELQIDTKQMAADIAAALADKLTIPDTLSLSTVAEKLDCSTQHVGTLIDMGHLEALDIAEDTAKRKSLRVYVRSLDAFMNSRRVTAA